MGGYHRYEMSVAFRWIFIIAAVAACIGGGISLSMWVTDRLLTRPTEEFAFAVDGLAHGGLTTFAKQISQAKEEILVCASEISSKAVIDALCDASRRKIRVRILMDGSRNRDATEGTSLGYMVRNKAGEIRATEGPLHAQFLLIDERLLFCTAAPWTTSATKEISPAFLTRSRGAGKLTRDYFETLFNQALTISGK